MYNIKRILWFSEFEGEDSGESFEDDYDPFLKIRKITYKRSFIKMETVNITGNNYRKVITVVGLFGALTGLYTFYRGKE